MKCLNVYLYILASCLVLLSGTSCSRQEEGMRQGHGNVASVIKAIPQAFQVDGVSSALDSDGEVKHIQACLFEDGLLTQVYADWKLSDGGYALSVARMSGTLYVLANLQELDLEALRDEGMTEREWLAMQVATAEGQVAHFFTGKLELDKQPVGQTVLPVDMKRGIARFDLRMRSAGLAVSRLTLKNVAQQGYVFEQDGHPSSSDMDVADQAYSFAPSLQADSLGFAYVYEQANPGLMVCVEGTAGGRKYAVEKALPQVLKRNAVYVLTLGLDEDTQEVSLDVLAWEDGGESALRPDWDGRIVIDREASALPEDAQVNEAGDELSLSCRAVDFTLAVDCDNELELDARPGLPLVIEPARDAGGQVLRNHFRVRTTLLPPNHPLEEAVVHFRRKGLSETYEEDFLTLRVLPNPIRLEGDLWFGRDDYTCDFARYVDNELGRFVMPEGYELDVRFSDGEDAWLKVEAAEGQPQTFRVIGGWRPNDKKADGREQAATLVVRRVSDGQETEVYVVKRRNFGLPVTLMNGVWWCKYNAQGHASDFADQILVPDDPAAKAGKSVLEYLNECSPEEYLALWNHSAYIGDSGVALEAVGEGGVVKLRDYRVPSVGLGTLDPKAVSPDGYEMPSVELYDRIFNGSSYMRFDASGGPYAVQSPWNGRTQVFTLSGNRADLQVDGVTLPTIYHAEVYNKLGGVKDEAVTFYGPGAQWNTQSINHNKMVIACHSPDELGWFHRFTGGWGLWRQRNGKENTAVVRFIKSPVEYIY